MIKGIIAYFAENRVAAMLLMAFLILGGLISASQLSIQLFPNLDLRQIKVTVISPGATPKEIEQDINRRIEQSIVGISGIDRVVTVAKQGVSRVLVELETFANTDSVLHDVKNAIDGIKAFPPASAQQPAIEVVEVESEVLTLAVSSPSASEDELRLVAEQIHNDLLDLPGISHVSLHGVRDREITIELDETQLRKYHLTFNAIERKIRQDSINLSHGELRSHLGNIVLHSIAKRSTGDEFAKIPLIQELDGTVVYLGDVATIRDGFADYEIHSEVNGIPTAFVRVDSDKDQSIANIAQSVHTWLNQQSFPEHVKVSVWNDRATPATKQVRKLLSNGLIGLVLVFICLVVVFDLRVATWITVGIPLSFIGSMLLFGTTDLTINIGTVFAFFLLIGIVVDDAVVVGENIANERRLGKNALNAAIEGARAMFAPISVALLTTAIAFVPFLFVTEERFQILNSVALVAFFVLLVSLIEAFLILPAHLAHEKPWSLSPLREIQSRANNWLDNLRDQILSPIVSWSIQHYLLTPIIAIVIVFGSILLIQSGLVRVIILDQSRSTSGSIQVELNYPVGTPYSTTLAAAKDIARAATETDSQFEGDSIKSISVLVGEAPMSLVTRDRLEKINSNHIATVTVHLKDQDLRHVSVHDFENAWRTAIGDTSKYEKLHFRSARFEPKPSIAYALRYEDRDVLQAAVTDFTAMLRSEPGVYGLSDNMTLGKVHSEIAITPQGRLANQTPTSVGAQLRSNFHGSEVQRIQRGHEEVPVIVRYPRESRKVPNALETERIRLAGNREIPLTYVAEITLSQELATLARLNGEQVAFVNGYADEKTTTPMQVRRQIASTHIPKLLEQYPGLQVDVDGGARSERKLIQLLSLLIPLVLLAMYVLVAAFLRSYWKPLIVVLGIPVALAGAIYSHWLLGWDFTAMSIFGVIGVSGVVVNDALVLLDRYNILRQKEPPLPAIAAAAAAMRHRFRAVFLTSLTTILGLSPLLYERSEELLNLVPFVTSMLGGLVFASLFTLFILPTLVMLIVGRSE